MSGAPNSELHTYNQALPLMMVRYMGPGLLGLGITALIAGFMSGMAGNVSAFSTVWTYDIYKPLIHKTGSDSHYVLVGRISIIAGVIVSIIAAYVVQQFHGIMDYVQALFSIFVAPLLATILFGMFWKRATRMAGFLGLLTGILFSAGLFLWVKFNPAALAIVALSPDAKPMAENVFRALWAFLFAAIVVFLVSLVTKPRPVAELEGLVYGATVLPKEEAVPFYKNVWLGRFWRCDLCRAQHHLLVTICVSSPLEERRKDLRNAWIRNSNLVFHRCASADLWSADLWLRHF